MFDKDLKNMSLVMAKEAKLNAQTSSEKTT